MHPVLFEIPLFGGMRLYTYGLMAALGFMAATWWVERQARREGMPPAAMTDLALLTVLTAIVGSRLLYVLMNWSSYASRPLAIFKLWEGGLVWYGGLIPCIGVGYLFVRRHQLAVGQVFDLFAPAVALGHVFGRIGCWAAGCCFGRPATSAGFYTWTFPELPHSLAPAGVPLYTTQLYEATGELALFLFLLLWRRRRRFAGELILLYLIGYSMLRTVVEHFRGDLPHGILGVAALTPTQLLSLGLMVVATLSLVRGWIVARRLP